MSLSLPGRLEEATRQAKPQTVLNYNLSTGNDGDGALTTCADGAKDFLLAEGFDRRYGARPLKRAIEPHLIIPPSRLIATSRLRAAKWFALAWMMKPVSCAFKKAPDLTMAIKYFWPPGSWRSKAV